MYGADTIKQMLQNYGNGTGLLAVFLCCVIWILGQGKENERNDSMSNINEMLTDCDLDEVRRIEKMVALFLNK